MNANILSAVMQFLTPNLIAKMASALGLDRGATQKAADAAVPAILAGLANLASSPDGAKQLGNVIAEQPQNTLANLSDMLGGSARIVDTGNSMLATLFGEGTLGTLASAVSKFAGTSNASSSSVLGMLAPVVLGILGRTQRENGLSTGSMAQMLTSQKDEFVRAMPASVSEQLKGNGYFDRLGTGAATSTRGEDTYRTDRAAPAVRTTPAPSMNWAYWAIPLAALAAGLGWYLLSADGSRRDASVRTTEAPDKSVQPVKAVSGATETDVGRRVTETINALQGQLQSIRDAGSASAALPKLREMSGQLDQLAELASQLPSEARERVANAIKAAHAKIKGTIDSIGPVASAAPGLMPALDALRTKLDTLAGARPPYFAKSPADALLLTAYMSRDVYNRAGEKLGAINDFIIGPDGRIIAAIIGVGGFLGMGEKEVALPFSYMQAARRDNDWQIVIDTDKAALKDAPTFVVTGERVRLKLSPKQ